jgi:succinyl-diaminopimelate desuccinylase
VADIRALAEQFGAEHQITDRAPSGPVALDSWLMQQLRKTTNAPIEAKQAWTDVARFGQLGIAACNFGPGEQAQAHQKGESCSEEALERGYRMLESFLKGPG